MNYPGRTFMLAILALVVVAGIWMATLPASLRRAREDASPTPTSSAAFSQLQAQLQKIRGDLQNAPLLRPREAGAIPPQIVESLQGKITASSTAK